MASPFVFISYSSKDVKIVEAIENHLLENGFDDKVWRDKRKIETDWSKEIANALSKSDIVLLIWSENSSKSEWVKNEWLMARALGKPIKIVIISDLKNAPLPKPLANIESIVFESKRESEDDFFDFNIQKISNRIRDVGSTSLSQIKYEYNILPDKRHIPFDLNPNFTGRDMELIDLYLEIIGDLSKLNYSKVGITGIGGVGKTQLAVEFFYRYAFAFDKGVFWIDGNDPSKWLEQIVAISRDYLELQISKEDNNTTTEENELNKQYIALFQKYCSANGSKMLIVVDNVIDPVDLNKDNILFSGDPSFKFTLLTLGCNLLFTTRRDFEGTLPNVKEHTLEMLSPDSTYEHLARYRKPESNEEIEYVKKICNSVGYLPLAIVLVGGYLRKYLDVTIQEYYEEHIKDRLGSIDLDQISDYELATKHTAAVRATFESEWNVLNKSSSHLSHIKQITTTETNLDAKKLISILSLFSESAIIPKNRLIIYSGIQKIGKTKLIRPAQSAFNLLDELNLVDILEDGKSVRMHPLLKEFVYEKVTQDEDEDNKPDKLKFKCITNLKKTYHDDFSCLVDEYSNQREGNINSIIEDVKTVLEWSKNGFELTKDDSTNHDIGNTIINPISSLYRVLEQESHNLRLKDKNSFISSVSDNIEIQLVFAQQIHIRATDLRQDEIAQRSREYIRMQRPSQSQLQSKNRFFVDILWARVKDKSALLRTLEGHSAYVESVTVTPDGTKIVSGSWDNTIKVWDLAASGRLVNTLQGHSSAVSSVAVTPDSTKIVSGSWDNTIKVWDLAASGRLVNTLQGHSSAVSSVAVTPDSTKIVSGSWDNTIKVWDLAASGRLLNTLEGHSDLVKSVAVTPDSTKVVSGSQDKTIKVWDLAASGRLLNTLEGHSDLVKSVAVTPDSTKVVSGSQDKTIKVWDLAASGRLLNTLEGHSSLVSSVAVTPDCTKIVSGSWDNTIKVWDIVSGRLVNTLEGHSDSVLSVAVTPDSTKVVSGSSDKTIKVWDLNNGSNIFASKFDSPIASIAISNNIRILVFGDFYGSVYVMNI